MINIDLPSLRFINLGYYSLCGREIDSSCSLVMRSMNEIM